MKKELLALTLLLPLFSFAQLSITSLNTVYTIDFDNTITGVNNSQYQGGDWAQSPAAGELDSDGWRMGHGGSFGTSVTGAGINSDPSSAGIYGIPVTASNHALGVQLGSMDSKPIWLKVDNNTGSTITSVDITYTLYYRNDATTETSTALNYSENEDGSGLNYLTETSFYTPNFGSAGAERRKCSFDARISPLGLTNGSSFYLCFNISSVTLGATDEVAIDDIRICVNNSGNILTSLSGAFDLIRYGFNSEMSGDITADKFEMTTGTSLTIPANTSLRTARLVNNGTVNLLDGASLYPITSSGISMSGTGTYFITRNKPSGQPTAYYNFWSSPVAAGNTGMLTGAYDIYKFTKGGDETSDYFTYSGALTPGEGIAARGVTSATFTGMPNTGDVGIAVTYNASSSLSSNLLGNPYPSSILAEEFINMNSGLLSAAVIYLWSQANPSTFVSTQDFIAVSALGSTAYDRDQLLSSTHIASCQGFFVDVGSSGTAMFSDGMRTNTNNTFKSGEELSRFWLRVSTEGRYAAALIGAKEDARMGTDFKYDARSFSSPDLDINSMIGGQPYCIQGIPSFTAGVQLPLQVKADQAGTYQISIPRFENLQGAAGIWLTDKKENKVQDLLEKPYVFTETGKTVYNDRFILGFASPTGINQHQGQLCKAWCQDGRLYVESSEPIEEAGVYDCVGRLLQTFTAMGKRIEAGMDEKGLLIIAIRTGSGREIIRTIQE